MVSKKGCNLDWWAKKRPKSQKIPSFRVKNGQQKPPQNRGGFCCVFGFFFLNFFVFFSLFLLNFLLFHDILEPQNSPPNEVTGVKKTHPPGKFGELSGKSGDFPEARGSLTPSQRLSKFVSKLKRCDL